MKKILSKIASVVLVAVMVVSIMAVAPVTASAAFTSGDFQYEIIGNNEAKITKYNGYSSNLSIPEMIDGHKVTALGSFIFAGNNNVSTVVIPSTVTSANMPFSNSTISSVVLMAGANKVADSLFYNCKNLTNVSFPTTVTEIGMNAFNGCELLSNVTLPKNIEKIGINAFYGCSSLKSIEIPATLTTVGSGAFSQSGITTATFESGRKIIPDYLFDSAVNLTTLTIPSTVTEIGRSSFNHCTSLKRLLFPITLLQLAMLLFMVQPALIQSLFQIPL